MTTRAEQLAELRNKFVTYWGSLPRREEFEEELDHIIYTAFAVAQEPFALELKSFRNTAIETTMLSNTPPVIPLKE